jgi:Protein of unknown function (DUF3073)
MGRGRSKAKQTKVARRLKYQTFDTDFASLQRELSGAERAELEAQEAEGADEYDDDYEDDDYR